MSKQIKEKFYNFAVSDFDGTIFNSHKEVSAETVNAINQFVDNGGVFCVCTGRMTGAIIHLLKDFGIDRGYVITYNGGEICNIATGEKIFKGHIDTETVEKIMKYAEENNFEALVYPNDKITVEKITPNNTKYMNMSGSSGVVLARKVSSYVKENNLTSGKCLFLIDDNEDAERIMRELPLIIGDDFTLTRSNPHHIDIMRKGISKGETVKRFAEMFNLDMNRLICFGDEMNDESMIKIAAVGAVPKNGAQALKSIADVIIDACDDDGVCKAIKKYCI